MAKTYRFYHDAGHGWLAVKKAELERLGISDKITGYSYANGGMVYLEEDLDAPAFVAAKKEQGEPCQIISISHGDRSPIRSYGVYES